MSALFVCASLLLTGASAALSSGSRSGLSLLSQARRLENNNDDAYDFSWVTDYSIQYRSCHTTLSFRADGGDSGDGTEEPTETERLVKFQLCPSDACSSNGKCSNGAEYLVEMQEFVEAVYESKMTQQEYNCETVQDNCDCDNYNDDDVCLAACYATAGLDYCEEAEDEDAFDIQEYLECREVEYGDDDGNSIYIGAYCAGSGIELGVFSDRQCTKQIENSVYEALSGYSLPTESLVDNTCISCKEPAEYDDDYNADQYDEDEVIEICEELYERSAKCESNLDITDKQTSGCNYMHNILPQMERVASSGRVSGSKAFMWIFLCTTVASSALAFMFYAKARRAKINLLDGGLLSA
jgi:hypothetical protein